MPVGVVREGALLRSSRKPASRVMAPTNVVVFSAGAFGGTVSPALIVTLSSAGLRVKRDRAV